MELKRLVQISNDFEATELFQKSCKDDIILILGDQTRKQKKEPLGKGSGCVCVIKCPLAGSIGNRFYRKYFRNSNRLAYVCLCDNHGFNWSNQYRSRKLSVNSRMVVGGYLCVTEHTAASLMCESNVYMIALEWTEDICLGVYRVQDLREKGQKLPFKRFKVGKAVEWEVFSCCRCDVVMI